MKFTDFRVLGSVVCCLALAMLTGCRTATPKPTEQPIYGGLMSGRGIVPPAYAEYQPAARPAPVPLASVEPLPPASEPLFVSESDNGFEVPDLAPTTEAVEAPVDTVAPLTEEAAPQPAPAKTRELPHLENGRAVPNLPGAPANRRGNAATSTTTASAAPVAGNNVYVVKSGDSLSKIASAHNVKAADILALNPNVTSADKIMVGQSLKMPANATGAGLEAAPVVTAVPADGLYTVQSGDSLWTIGKRFGVKREDIKAWNNLTSDKLKVGQQLRLKADASQPAKKSVAPPAPAPVTPAPSAPAPVTPAPEVAAPAPAAEPAEAPAAVEPPVEPTAPAIEPAPAPAAVRTYQISVFENDTLETIAETTGVTVQTILDHNPQIKSNADLVKDMVLMIPETQAEAPAQP